jgi:flagellar hook-basal body complex protein FliE
MVPILPVNLHAPPILTPSAPSLPSTGGEAFSSVLADAVQKVEDYQKSATDSVNKFLSGEGEELHTVAIKAQQAEMSFDLFMQVRNKVVAAYQSVMGMQV